jgi:DNA-binding SARP family transcriptional activator
MWPDTERPRPHNNLSALVSRLQSSLRAITRTHHIPPLITQDGGGHEADDPARIVATDGSIYRLNPALVEVDYWTFLAATAAARTDELAATDAQQQPDDASADLVRDLSAAHGLYGGPLADGVDHEWILSVREAARRSYLAMTAQLVRHHLGPAAGRGSSARVREAAQIGAASAILEAARNIEPTNQAIYRDIIALQLRSGNNEAASHTVGLLLSQLDDIGEQPDPETRALIDQVNRTRAG